MKDTERWAADPLLTLKVLPPRPRKDNLARARLDQRFTSQLDIPVVVIEAPAGYGKTLLLAQWRRAAMAEGAAAAWLTLDERDDARRLLEGVVLAIRQATGRFDFALNVDWVRSDPDWPMRAAATILADWSRLARPTVLLLDDFDRLTPCARSIGRYLMANLPPNGRILVGLRAIEDRPWALELQAYGQLAILGRADLAFTVEESMAFLQQRLPGRFTPALGAQLHERTAGWPMALELFSARVAQSPDATSAMTAINDPASAFALVRDGARNIAGYLIDAAVSASGSPSARALLVEISLMGPLTAELAAAATGRADAPEIIADLRAHSALLLDSENGTWFRLHHMALEPLREEARRLPCDHRRQIHRRAAQWLISRGLWESAATHAFEAGETTLAADCLERSLHPSLAAGKFELVDSWLKRLPPEEVSRRPHLRLAMAIRLAIAGSPQHEPLIADLAKAREPKLRFAAAMVRAFAAGHTDDPDAGARALAEWSEPCSDNPVILRGYYNVRRWLDGVEGLPQKRRTGGRDESPMLGDAALGGSVALHQRAVAFLRDAQPMQATRVLTPALARLETTLGRRAAPSMLVAVSLAAAACEQDDFASARILLADRLDLLDPSILPDGLAHGFISAALLAQHDRQSSRALDLLELLLARARSRGLVRIQAVAAGELVRFHAAAGRPEPCERLAAELCEVADEAARRGSLNAKPILLEAELAQARTLWSRRDAKAALARSEATIDLAQRLQRRRIELEARLLHAAAVYEISGEFAPDLSEVVNLADSLRLKRMLREAGLVLQPTLRRLVGAEVDRPDLTPDTPALPKAAPRAAPEAPAMLTAREAQVLLLLSRGLSNKEIANALDIGDGTIKWHLKNLFLKFDATDRKHVVARARLLGLVEAA